ncbi:MAG: hypothetical protein EA399_09095 [Desulfovibrionales bacterium]|nr:MAG: hypothetical protein EA399_09095 [Desulfovibrionales bacterium]
MEAHSIKGSAFILLLVEFLIYGNYSAHPGQRLIPELDSRLRGDDVFFNAVSESVMPVPVLLQTGSGQPDHFFRMS